TARTCLDGCHVFVAGKGRVSFVRRLTAERRVPAMSTTHSFAEEGGLMAYQEYTRDTEQRVAGFVAKILKGQACRPTGRAAAHVRVGDQPKNRQDVGADHPADAPTPGGPHHRVARARPTRPAPPRSARLRRASFWALRTWLDSWPGIGRRGAPP